MTEILITLAQHCTKIDTTSYLKVGKQYSRYFFANVGKIVDFTLILM